MSLVFVGKVFELVYAIFVSHNERRRSSETGIAGKVIGN